MKRCRQYFIPAYGNYYHFISETALGLHNVLHQDKQLEKKDYEFWYKGKYAPIIQLFSRHPVHMVENWAEIPSPTMVLPHFRPKTHEHWLAMRPLGKYLEAMVDPQPETAGITVIKRVHSRKYAEHDDLVRGLAKFGLPIRVAILEKLSFPEQINLMRNTAILLGPHGAGVTNMIFLPKGSAILELYPKGFYCRVFRAMARVFGHLHVDLESANPSVIGRQPPPLVQKYLERVGWPSRKEFFAWKPNRMELGRVLRDVHSFSIDPELVLNRLEQMLSKRA
jgi:hypothetical protein